MRLKPLSDRVLVKRVESETKTAGGIIIPDAAKEKPVEGIVVAVGPGNLSPEGDSMDMQVEEGDKVLFGQYSGIEVKVNGEEHLILREDEILAVVKEDLKYVSYPPIVWTGENIEEVLAVLGRHPSTENLPLKDHITLIRARGLKILSGDMTFIVPIGYVICREGNKIEVYPENEITADAVEEEKEVEPSGPGQPFPEDKPYPSEGQGEGPVTELPVEEEEGAKEV